MLKIKYLMLVVLLKKANYDTKISELEKNLLIIVVTSILLLKSLIL